MPYTMERNYIGLLSFLLSHLPAVDEELMVKALAFMKQELGGDDGSVFCGNKLEKPSSSLGLEKVT